MPNKRIAIVGAGATGMTATKACLEQGLDVVVFEKTNYTGGLWRFQETVAENGIASVMKSTIINSSKELSAFSDFPPPTDFPNFMHNTKMVRAMPCQTPWLTQRDFPFARSSTLICTQNHLISSVTYAIKRPWN